MSVHVWGTGNCGELGLGKGIKQKLDPALVENLVSKKVRTVACGEQFSMALTELGDVFIWGRGREGQLGNNETVAEQHIPKRVWTLKDERIKDIAAGYHHCLALSNTGQLFEWGKVYKEGEKTKEKMFGDVISLQGLANPQSEADEWKLKMLMKSAEMYYAATNKSQKATEELQESQELYNFGSFKPHTQLTPRPVNFKLPVVQVSAGYSFSIAVLANGHAYGWGFNEKFQLGLGHRYNQAVPQRIIFPTDDIKIKAVACGQQHSLCLSSTGDMFSFGLGVFGQLGHGTTHDSRRPRQIAHEKLLNETFVKIACGSFHSIALSSKGIVWTWGSSEYAQQGGIRNDIDWGNGRASKKEMFACAIPRSLSGCFKQRKIIDIKCGQLFNLGIDERRDVWTWGWGSFGVLGHGSHKYCLVPKKIQPLAGERLVCVSGGRRHVMAVSLGFGEKESGGLFSFSYKQVYLSKKYSDLEITLDSGDEYPVHKAIIATRCPSLMRKISSSNDDKSTTKYKLTGIRKQLFLGLLHYIYTDQVKIPHHMIMKLAQVAQEYDLKRLDRLCEKKQHQEEERFSGLTDMKGDTVDKDLETEDDYDDGDDDEELKKVDYNIPESKFHEDFARLINSPTNADVCLVLRDANGQEKRVFAHRVLLATRCEYFDTILSGSFKEAAESLRMSIEGRFANLPKIAIDLGSIPCRGSDVFQVFMKMLEFIYAGDESCLKLGEWETTDGEEEEEEGDDAQRRVELILDLILFCDRFLVEDLKQLCEYEVENMLLDSTNVVYLMELSDRANASRLKKNCVELLLANWENLLADENSRAELASQLNHVNAQNPHLLKELDEQLEKQTRIKYKKGDIETLLTV